MFALTFLGTSASVPSAERNHPALLVEAGSHRLVDCGEGRLSQTARRPAALAAAIIDATAAAPRKDPSQAADVIARIRSHGGKLFERIAMRVVATSPKNASEIAYAFLSDEAIIDADWCRDEYAAVANAWFPSAPQAVRTGILEYIDALPDGHLDAWQKWFLETHGRLPTPDETREYRFGTVRDVVWGWRDVLPEPQRREIEAGIAEFGGRDAVWQRVIRRRKVR